MPALLQQARDFTQLEKDLAMEAATRLQTWLEDSLWRFDAVNAERGVIFQILLDRGAAIAVALNLSKKDYLTACEMLFDFQKACHAGT